MRNILLIEPSYKTKYPPLGLMKISTYHKLNSDVVYFIKGLNYKIKQRKWDRIYISTLFTYHWNQVIKTINYYINSVAKPQDIFIGGVLATLFKDKLQTEYNISIISGLIDKAGILGKDKFIVDELIPDYSIIEEIDFKYKLNNAYLSYATRGCPNKCPFCTVYKIEHVFSAFEKVVAVPLHAIDPVEQGQKIRPAAR